MESEKKEQNCALGQSAKDMPEYKCPKCAKVVLRHFPPTGPEKRCPGCGTKMILNNRYRWGE